MSRALLALLLLCAVSAHARAPDPLAVLDECVAGLDSGLDVGYKRIADRCPDLASALEHSAWAPWLPSDWNQPNNELSAQSLRELRTALQRAESVPAGERVLHPQRAQAVLDRVAKPKEEHVGLLQRCLRWLRELLAPRPQQEQSWWRRLLGDVTVDQAALRIITWLAVALLVLMALAVVINELRVAGLLRRRTAAALVGVPRASGERFGLDDVDRAEARAQPALLLELLASRLAARELLPPARALTVHELTHRARLRDEGERTRLRTLASVTEQLRYADVEVAPPVLAAALRGGRELLAALATVGAG